MSKIIRTPQQYELYRKNEQRTARKAEEIEDVFAMHSQKLLELAIKLRGADLTSSSYSILNELNRDLDEQQVRLENLLTQYQTLTGLKQTPADYELASTICSTLIGKIDSALYTKMRRDEQDAA